MTGACPFISVVQGAVSTPSLSRTGWGGLLRLVGAGLVPLRTTMWRGEGTARVGENLTPAQGEGGHGAGSGSVIRYAVGGKEQGAGCRLGERGEAGQGAGQPGVGGDMQRWPSVSQTWGTPGAEAGQGDGWLAGQAELQSLAQHAQAAVARVEGRGAGLNLSLTACAQKRLHH